MIKSFSTSIEKKKWAEISALLEMRADLRRSYKVTSKQKATIIMDNYGIRGYVAEWGLIPEWSKDAKIRGTLINARFENLLSSPSFRIPIRQKRCLVPVDSYYIKHRTRSKDIPFRVLLRNEEPMFIAGLWDKWESPRYGTRITFSIITNDSGEDRNTLGDRVPMIFTSLGKGVEWLQTGDLKTCVKLLNNPRFDDLKVYRISEEQASEDERILHREVKQEITLFD